NSGVTATTANYTVDTIAPAVSSFTLSDNALQIGDSANVTLVFSEAVTGFSSADDITAANGILSAMTSANGGITWTGTFTPTAAIEDIANLLSLADTYTDLAGNTGVTATTANYSMDTITPAVSSFTLSDNALQIGDSATVTLVFSEAVTGFSSADDITAANGQP
ncbi:MAG: Ig-like domain-containing protein, partial [Cyanobacteria bacterium]|nr:Ig-like domain-containing protein [Cyanobacteriota bacterium]